MIGEILKKYRELKGLNKKEAGDLVGISDSFWSRIENEKREISPKLLEKIINKFEMSEIDSEKIKELQALKEVPEIIKNKLEEKGIDINNLDKMDEYCEKILLPCRGEASAGFGRINCNEPTEYIEVSKHNFSKKSFVVKVLGDSMEPEIKDGSIIIVDPNQCDWDYINNKIAVVRYKDEIYVKRLRLRNNGRVILLESINPAYETITILSEDIEYFKCYGKVVGVEYKKYF